MNKTIVFSTRHHPESFLRQIPGDEHCWNGYHFVLPQDNRPVPDEAEWLVVYDDPKTILKTSLPKSRRILFVAEPPTIKIYPPKYLNQFGIVVCPYSLKGFKGKRIVSHTALPWHFAVAKDGPDDIGLDYDALSSMAIPEKEHKLSVVCSKKTMNEAHKARLTFLEKLKDALGDKLVIFGRGFQEIDDKAKAILPYKFHLCLENNFEDHFWTEKLADAYLGFAYPFHSGCRNISEYFSMDEITPVDLSNTERTIQIIKDIIADESFYEKHFKNVVDARNKILNQYNLFLMIQNIIEESSSPKNKTILSNKIYDSTKYERRKLIDIIYPWKVRLVKFISKEKQHYV